jgi:hypothetical protein
VYDVKGIVSENALRYKDLESIYDLYKKGVLTEEEYQSKKSEILSKIQ